MRAWLLPPLEGCSIAPRAPPLLQDNPDISENIARISTEREGLSLLLEKTLTDLRDGHYASLVTFVEREHSAREKMRAVTTKEEEVMREVKRLSDTLREEDEKHASEMELKRKELNELKERLRKLKIDTTLTLRYARKEAMAKTEATARTFTAEEMEVMSQIEELRKRLDIEHSVHEQTLDVLRRGAPPRRRAGAMSTARIPHAHHHPATQSKRSSRARRRSGGRGMRQRWRGRSWSCAASQRSGRSRGRSWNTSSTAMTAISWSWRSKRCGSTCTPQTRAHPRMRSPRPPLARIQAEEERKREDEAMEKAEAERRRVAASRIQQVVGEMFGIVSSGLQALRDAKKAKGAGKKKKK